MQMFPYRSIKTQYAQLLADTRKKDTQIRLNLEKALTGIEEAERLPDKPIANNIVNQMVTSLTPLIHKKTTKIYHTILSIFQALSASALLSFDQKIVFLELAIELLDAGDDMIPIKVIQIVLIMLNRGDIVKQPMANKVSTLCLKAFNSKIQIIKNNVFAVIQQMYTLLFEQYTSAIKLRGNIEKSELDEVCYGQLEQLISLAGIKTKHTRFKGLGLDCLTMILADAGEALVNSSRILSLLENSYIPCLLNYFTHSANSFTLITRAVKAATQLMLVTQNSYSLVQPMLSMANSHKPWQRCLILESFSILLGRYRQIQLMNRIVSSTTNMRLLGDLINAIVNITPKIPEMPENESFEKLNMIYFGKLHELHEAVNCDPPNPGPSQYFSVLESLKELLTAEGIVLGEPMIQPFTKRQTEEAVNILEYVLKPTHEMLEYTLKEFDDEIQIQQILHNIQSFVNMTGTVGLNTALQNIISTLCMWEFPEDLKDRDWDNGYKHIYVCNTIFNIAQCNNKVLDKKSWMVIFSFLQQISERIYGCEKLKNISFKSLEKKVAENFARYLPKDNKSKTIIGDGTIQEMLMPFSSKEKSPLTKSLSLSDNEDNSMEKAKKSKEVQLITHNTERDNIKPVTYITADANINFYKLNTMLAKKKAINSKQDNDKAIFFKQSKMGAFRNELDFIKGSLESLFIFTSLFDVLDATLEELVKALGQMVINSLEIALNANSASKEINKFALLKMVETCIVNIFRIYYVWDYIGPHFEYLATQKLSRELGINAITCLIKNILNYQKEKDNQFKKLTWQIVVLAPLMNIILANDIDSTQKVVSSLKSILEDAGSYINRDGWQIILGIIEKVIAPTNPNAGALPNSETHVEQIFKCIEYICHNSLHKIHITNIESLIVIIYYFTTIKDNLNTALLAVSFMHNVADYLSQQFSEDLSVVKKESIWNYLLSKLRDIGVEERGELRHTAYKTLGQIVATHAKEFSINNWRYILINIAQILLKFGEVNYFAYTKGKSYVDTLDKDVINNIKLLAKIPENVIPVEEDTKEEKVEEKTEEVAEEKVWEETVTVFHVSLIRCLIKLYSLKDFMSEYFFFINMCNRDDRSEVLNNSYTLLLENWSQLVKSNSFNILSTIYKSIQLMATKCQVCFYKQFENAWQVFIDSVNWIINSKCTVIVNSKPLLIKLIPVIIELLRVIFSPEVVKEFEEILSKNYMSDLYKMLVQILKSVNVLENAYIMKNPIKLISEEKLIFEFVEYLPKIFNNVGLQRNHFRFLFGFLQFKKEKPHTDGIIRKTLVTIKSFIMSYKLNKELIKEILNELYPKLGQLIALRFQNDICRILISNGKDQPLWYEVGNYAVHLSTYIVDHKLHIEQQQKEVKETHEFSEDKEVQDLAWKHVIRLIKEIVNVPEYQLNNLEKSFMSEIIEKSQDLDIILINFILKVLLPSSQNLDRDSQQDLIILIDSGCTAFNTSFSSISSKNSGEVLDKFCISSLIKLCNCEEERESKFYPIKQKIASITTPILVNRCKAIFHKYLTDEKLSGMVPLPSNRKTALIELMENLKGISIFPNSLPTKEGGIMNFLAGGKAHLIYLMPEIVDCITTKESDLRSILKGVMTDINHLLLGDIADLKELPIKFNQ